MIPSPSKAEADDSLAVVESVAWIEAVQSLADHLMCCSSLAEVVSPVIQIAARLAGTDDVDIWLVNESRASLYTLDFQGNPAREMKPIAGLTGSVARTARSQMLTNASGDPRFEAAVDLNSSAHALGSARHLLIVPVPASEVRRAAGCLPVVAVLVARFKEVERIPTGAEIRWSTLIDQVGGAFRRFYLEELVEQRRRTAKRQLMGPAAEIYRDRAMDHALEGRVYGPPMRTAFRTLSWMYRFLVLLFIAGSIWGWSFWLGGG